MTTLQDVKVNKNMQVVIHAGVAFTDEGRFVELFKINTKVLSNQNVTLSGFGAYKQHFRPALDTLEPGSDAASTRESFLKRLPKDNLVDRAILSTPRFIGEIETSIMDGQFFPHAGQRIAYLGDVFDGMQVDLFLGLRNPGSFIPRVLMSLPEVERRRIMDQTDLSCLSWLTMIDNIRDLAPDVNITIWSNEESPLIWGDIARAMAGLPEHTTLNEEFSLLSSLLSDAGKQEIQALIQRNLTAESPDLRTELSRIFEEHALPDAIEEELDLPGWSDDIISAFTEIYEQDLAMLESMPEIRFLRP